MGAAPTTPRRPPRGAAVGLGFRPEIAGDLLGAPGTVDFVEVVAEACFASAFARREAVALSRTWTVVPHGVKLSLGSAEGIDVDRARRLGALARELAAPMVTEHVAFVRAGGREIGHLTQVPFTREAVRVVARNVAAARRELPDVPLLLENTAWTFRWPGDELDEASFFCAIVEATGCDLLLDLGNLYANARNAGADPLAVLAAYPLDRVGMVHLAGGAHEDGFYFDTHAHAVPDAVFELLAALVHEAGPAPVVLERDDAFPTFAELGGELARARHVLAAKEARAASTPRSTPVAPEEPAVAMAAMQATLARLLTDAAAPPEQGPLGFELAALQRSREVLQRKRVDDALPLLARLAKHGEAARAVGRACLDGRERAPALSGISDAIRIARAALADPALASAARADLLLLESRFVTSDEDRRVRPRAAPFVGRARLGEGRELWVLKGFGPDAPPRVFERRAAARPPFGL
jgi:uncharacterized protein (UPF0276 family)